ncbi:MAG: hypothetical protein U0793_04380 [Gemmataceae bacterium]
MLQFLLDTDHFTLSEHGHAHVGAHVGSAAAGTRNIYGRQPETNPLQPDPFFGKIEG